MNPPPSSHQVRESIAVLFVDAGLEPGTADGLAEALGPIIEYQARRMAAEIIVALLPSLDDSPAVVAFRRVLGLAGEETRRAAAKRIGVSDAAIAKAEKAIQERLVCTRATLAA